MRAFRDIDIRRKLALVLLLTSSIGPVIAGAAIMAYAVFASRQRTVEDASTLADLVGIQSVAALDFKDPKAAEQLLATLRSKPEIAAAALYAADGTLFARYTRDGGAEAELPPRVQPLGAHFTAGSLHLFQQILRKEEVVGTIYLRTDMQRTYARMWRLAGVMAGAIISFTLLTLLIAGRVQRVISEPILNLARVAQEVAEGKDYSVRAEQRSQDEIGRLTGTFNQMLTQIQERDTALRRSNDALHGEVLERLRAEEALRASAEELRALNETLEQRVRERTEALEMQARELSRSNAELEMFAYVASHDLQEPLRGVAGCMQLLERRYKDKLDAGADELITHAVGGATRMQSLVNDLLAYSRVGTRGKPFEPTEMETVLGRALANLRAAIEESGARITHDALPTLPADPTQLTQLFQNLIGNAIKFRREGVVPEIHVGAERDAAAGEWRFCVRDNGIGIDAQYAERIFVIFQRLHTRTAYPGTGIGLAVCKKIVERHGGRIWVASQPEQGSTFIFTIPDRGEQGPWTSDTAADLSKS